MEQAPEAPTKEEYALRSNPDVVLRIGELSVGRLLSIRNGLTEQAANLWEDIGVIDKAIESAQSS